MSKDWVKDIHEMHNKYKLHDWVDACIATENFQKLYDFIGFRLDCIAEELQEGRDARYERDSEETVDALIDLCVFAIGTLDLMGVNSHKAWDEVLKANMNKEVGLKEGRSNPFGLPDLAKPADWKAPSHEGNHGILPHVYNYKG